MVTKKELARVRRHKRVRKKVVGISPRPRLAIFRSLNHIYAQVIDDFKGEVLVAASSLSKELKGKIKGSNVKGAYAVGELIAQKALAKKIEKVVFDRKGYLYHGRTKALAEAARKAGLKF
jgi:large subunit ribosomal protein L18